MSKPNSVAQQRIGIEINRTCAGCGWREQPPFILLRSDGLCDFCWDAKLHPEDY